MRSPEAADSVKKGAKRGYEDLVFTSDNSENIRRVMGLYKNVLICGIKGVGKITRTVTAVKDNTNVYYVGNPLDYEGKRRPGSYEKYLTYIRSLKDDITIVEDIVKLFRIKSEIVLIIDEIYGRSDVQLERISRLMDMENIQIFQIVGCLKNMAWLINKVDINLELHHDGAFVVDRDLARAICEIFGKKTR
ncbi:MAG: hypothetical protein P8013_07830 [Candidatus Sulfobium sp.]|jgi:hypothetical protein